jgi:hypothetical protein
MPFVPHTTTVPSDICQHLDVFFPLHVSCFTVFCSPFLWWPSVPPDGFAPRCVGFFKPPNGLCASPEGSMPPSDGSMPPSMAWVPSTWLRAWLSPPDCSLSSDVSSVNLMTLVAPTVSSPLVLSACLTYHRNISQEVSRKKKKKKIFQKPILAGC